MAGEIVYIHGPCGCSVALDLVLGVMAGMRKRELAVGGPKSLLQHIRYRFPGGISSVSRKARGGLRDGHLKNREGAQMSGRDPFRLPPVCAEQEQEDA